MSEPDRQPDPRTTLFRALVILAMLAVAVIGLCYSIRLLWTPPGKQ